MKRCTKCHVIKPLTDFPPRNNRPSGFQSHCRACAYAYRHDYYHLHRDALLTQERERHARQKLARPPKAPKTSKRCTRCKETKPLTAFVMAPHRNGRQYPMSRCRDCLSIVNKDHLLSLKVTDPAGYEAFREQRNASIRAWYADKVQKDPAYRDAMTDKSARRRVKKNGVGQVSKVDRAAVIARDRSLCHICGEPVVHRKDLSIDHLIPVIDGGDHTPRNLAVAHIWCNKRRGAGRLPAQLRLF